MVVLINGKKFDAEYLTTPEQIENGMMGRDKLNGCMVFKMNKGYHTFWMKNCLITLDIIILKNNIIQKIHHNCVPCLNENCENYCGTGNMVLELLGGTCKNFGFKEGDSVYFQ